jgi:outer membrane usher protein
MLHFILLLLVASKGVLFSMSIEIEVPLYLNNAQHKTISITIDEDSSEIFLDTYSISSAVEDDLTVEGMKCFDDFVNKISVMYENTAIVDENFKISFSTVNQSIYLEVALPLLRRKYSDVRRPKVAGYAHGGKKIKPENFSGYLNVEAGFRNRHSFINQFNPTGISNFGNFNCCVHYKDTVFTGFGYFLANNTLGINPGNAVLTKQFKESRSSFSLGSINPLGIAFQGSSPLIGLNISKDSQLFTDPTVGAMSRHDIFLNAPSEVRIIVNGIDVNRLDLPAGNHTLQNFPLAQGLNNVVLKITGATGEEREVDLSMFYNPSLKKIGEIETNVSLGIPAYNVTKGAGGFYRMDPSFAVTGYVKGGVFNYLTLGGYFQLMEENYFTGIQGVVANPYLKSIIECGLSGKKEIYPSYKLRVALLQSDTMRLPFSWSMVFENSQPGFRYFGGSNIAEKLSYQFSGSMGFNGLKAISINVTGQYGVFFDVGHKYSIQSTVSIRPKSWLSLRGMIRYDESDTTPGKIETAINFDLSPKYNDFGTKTNYNTKQKAVSSVLTYNKALLGNRSIYGSVGYNDAPGSGQVEGQLTYEGSMARFSGSQQLYKSSSNVVDSTVAVTNINAGTALVFAGKTVALSRPLRDSFVVIKPNKYMKGKNVIVNPSKERYLAKASYLRPSVIPLHSYSDKDISMITGDGSYGGEFEDTSYHLTTLNRSGSVVEVGSPSTYIVEGVMYTDGRVLQEVTGMFISNFTINGKPLKVKFFTDEEGVFQIGKIVPGSYTIAFVDQSLISIENFQIKEDGDDINYIHVGDIFVKTKDQVNKMEYRKHE